MFNSWAIRLRNDVRVFTNQLWYTWKRLCNHWCAIIFIVLWLLIWMHATISLLSDQTREIIHLALSHTHTVPLSSPPQVTFKQINFTTAHLLVRLPMMGTPPILNLTVTVTYHITQDSHTKTKKGLFNNGEIVSVHFDKLLSGVRYTVMAVATNLLGSSNISTGMEFVTGEHQ